MSVPILDARDCELAGFNLSDVLAEAAWQIEPRQVPPELEPGYPAVYRTSNGDPINAAAFTALRVITEQALTAAHAIVDRLDADEA